MRVQNVKTRIALLTTLDSVAMKPLSTRMK